MTSQSMRARLEEAQARRSQALQQLEQPALPVDPELTAVCEALEGEVAELHLAVSRLESQHRATLAQVDRLEGVKVGLPLHRGAWLLAPAVVTGWAALLWVTAGQVPEHPLACALTAIISAEAFWWVRRVKLAKRSSVVLLKQ